MKKAIQTIIQILFVATQFIVINIIIAFIIWVNRDIKLIELTNLHNEFSFFQVLFTTILFFGLIPFLFVVIINYKKSYAINSSIFVLLAPFKIIIFLVLLLMFLGGFEFLCHWNPLIDTRHSKNFNIYNIDKIQEDMTEFEVISLIGDPLKIIENENRTLYLFTEDAKSKIGDWAWFEATIYFIDGKLTEKRFKWAYD